MSKITYVNLSFYLFISYKLQRKYTTHYGHERDCVFIVSNDGPILCEECTLYPSIMLKRFRRNVACLNLFKTIAIAFNAHSITFIAFHIEILNKCTFSGQFIFIAYSNYCYHSTKFRRNISISQYDLLFFVQ